MEARPAEKRRPPSVEGRQPEYIATGDQDSTVHFWKVASGRDLMAQGYATKVRNLSWDSSSRYLGDRRWQRRPGLGLLGKGAGRHHAARAGNARGFDQRACLSAS